MQRTLLLILVLAVLLGSGCVPGDGAATPESPAGVFSGIWHGWIAPVSLVLCLFNPKYRVYEPVNTGHWYDLAFYIAIIGGFGGVALIRRRHGKSEL